jgi:hypothetical protein
MNSVGSDGVVPPRVALRPPGCEAHIRARMLNLDAQSRRASLLVRLRLFERPAAAARSTTVSVMGCSHTRPCARAHEHELLLQQVPELAPVAVDRLKASKLGTLC